MGGIDEKDKTPQAKALDRLMRSAAWRVTIYPRLLKMARPLAGIARLQPSDLAQMAIVRLYAVAMRGEGQSWDDPDPEVFLNHMMGVLKSERSNTLRKPYNKLHVHESDMPTRNPHDEGGDDVGESYVDRAPHPDGDADVVIEQRRDLERAAKNARAIHAELPPLAQKALVALLLQPGKWDPKAFADEHGVPVRDVYMARREITRKTEAMATRAAERDPDDAFDLDVGDDDDDAWHEDYPEPDEHHDEDDDAQ